MSEKDRVRDIQETVVELLRIENVGFDYIETIKIAIENAYLRGHNDGTFHVLESLRENKHDDS